MKFIVLTSATANEPWADSAAELYISKIKHFTKFEISRLKPTKNARAQAHQKKEDDSQKILDFLSADDFVVLFDETGSSLDSKQFAKKIESIQNSGKKRTIFILGGAFGVSDAVKKRAQLQISLSKMVFNHLVAEVVVLEQIYRAFTILHHFPYHNE